MSMNYRWRFITCAWGLLAYLFGKPYKFCCILSVCIAAVNLWISRGTKCWWSSVKCQLFWWLQWGNMLVPLIVSFALRFYSLFILNCHVVHIIWIIKLIRIILWLRYFGRLWRHLIHINNKCFSSKPFQYCHLFGPIGICEYQIWKTILFTGHRLQERAKKLIHARILMQVCYWVLPWTLVRFQVPWSTILYSKVCINVYNNFRSRWQ